MKRNIAAYVVNSDEINYVRVLFSQYTLLFT